ncbi:MAG: hypothetical protein IJ837_01465 [Clostridia bacterium]|nr:hypothetical protein [Clostridia bacterium]
MEKTKSKIWQALAAFALCFAIILTFGACGEPTENKNEVTAEEIEVATTTLSNVSETFKEIETKKEQNELNFFTQTEQVTNGASLGLSKEFYDENYLAIDDENTISSYEIDSINSVIGIIRLLETKKLEFNKLYIDTSNSYDKTINTCYFEINGEEKNIVCNAASDNGHFYYFSKIIINFTSDWSDWESIEAMHSSIENDYYEYRKFVNSTNKILRPYFDSWTEFRYVDERVSGFYDLNLIAGKYYEYIKYSNYVEHEVPAELTTAVVNKMDSLNYEEQEKEIKSKCLPFTIINFSELVKGE